mmetsp:Transcript_83219/g.232092  ORF Transcript_83219/g.232092 Transcript_83219/m.232092 type:complete len:315 (+) Transcript_83219:258-1202(+)
MPQPCVVAEYAENDAAELSDVADVSVSLHRCNDRLDAPQACERRRAPDEVAQARQAPDRVLLQLSVPWVSQHRRHGRGYSAGLHRQGFVRVVAKCDPLGGADGEPLELRVARQIAHGLHEGQDAAAVSNHSRRLPAGKMPGGKVPQDPASGHLHRRLSGILFHRRDDRLHNRQGPVAHAGIFEQDSHRVQKCLDHGNVIAREVAPQLCFAVGEATAALAAEAGVPDSLEILSGSVRNPRRGLPGTLKGAEGAAGSVPDRRVVGAADDCVDAEHHAIDLDEAPRPRRVLRRGSVHRSTRLPLHLGVLWVAAHGGG